MPTLKDVAARAGVSRATASRVLAGSTPTSDSAREAVLAAAAELHYRPNTVARSLRTARTSTLGLIVSDVRNPFFTDLVHSVEQAAFAAGLATVVCNADESAAQQDRYVETLLGRQVDGLVVTPQGDGSGALRAAVESGVPTVFVDRAVAGLDVPCVTSDDAGGVASMLDHLLALGHRRIGVIAGPQTISTGRNRLAAVREQLAARGTPLPDELVRVGDFRRASGVRAAGELLDLPQPPDVLFAADGLMAVGAFEELRRRGLRIGTDVGLASFDELSLLGLVDPPVTAVAQDVAALGREAVARLLAVIAGDPAEDVVLDTHLVVGRSCGEGEKP